MQNKTDAVANSVDPDVMVRYEPSHQDLHCILFWFLNGNPICNSGYVQIQSRKRPLQNFSGERVKLYI